MILQAWSSSTSAVRARSYHNKAADVASPHKHGTGEAVYIYMRGHQVFDRLGATGRSSRRHVPQRHLRRRSATKLSPAPASHVLTTLEEHARRDKRQKHSYIGARDNEKTTGGGRNWYGTGRLTSKDTQANASQWSSRHHVP